MNTKIDTYFKVKLSARKTAIISYLKRHGKWTVALEQVRD